MTFCVGTVAMVGGRFGLAAFNAAGVFGLVSGASAAHPLEFGLLPVLSSWLAAGALIVLLTRVSQNPEALRARAADRV